MGKRKHKDKNPDEIRRKIRRLEKQLNRRRRSYNDNEYYKSDCSIETAHSGQLDNTFSQWEMDDSDENSPSVRSVVEPVLQQDSEKTFKDTPIASTSHDILTNIGATPDDPDIDLEVSESRPLPMEILEALGDSKTKPEVLGPKIREEISQRWERILLDGLGKDNRQKIRESVLLPQNFQMLKAPKLNPEISAVVAETARNRDTRLERYQNDLGIGLASITNLLSAIIDDNIEKSDIIKKLSETGQFLLDLHFRETLNRRNLIMYSLDKKFLDIIRDVKRDSFLFGENLGEKIRATKSAEKSGLQIKRTDRKASSNHSANRSIPRQGNVRGPPLRQYNQQYQNSGRGRVSGPRPMTSYNRRLPPAPPAAPGRYQAPPRPNPRQARRN